MRKINTRDFRLATRRTPREVNRQIVLNLIRELQPISRAELARRMSVRRGALTPLVRELIERGEVSEAGAARTARGRRPTLLSLRSGGQLVLAADVRRDTTFLALADPQGRLLERSAVRTPDDPAQLPELLAKASAELLARRVAARGAGESCVGLGVVVPGIVDRRSGRLVYAPRLGWRDVELRARIAERVGLATVVESAPMACALSRLWLAPEETRGVGGFAYVHVSDGVGVGLVLNGEALRGDGSAAGEFGHVRLDPGGPVCACGRVGCWEALACNSATIARYAGPERRANGPTIEEVVRRARLGEPAAVAALAETGRQIGRGLALVVSAFNPGRIYVGGEVSAAWSLLERPLREAMEDGALPDAARATVVVPDSSPAEHRLAGAVALVNAPAFAALAVG